MHHQSKERNMSKLQKKKKKKKLTRAFPFGLARFRFNEVRINEVPLYFETVARLLQGIGKVVTRWWQGCYKVVRTLSQGCPQCLFTTLAQSCHNLVF